MRSDQDILTIRWSYKTAWSVVMIRNCLEDKPVGGKGVPTLVGRCCGVAEAQRVV